MSSSPLRPLLTTQTMSNARRDSMNVMTRTMMLIGRMTGKIDPEERLRLRCAVDGGRFAQATGRPP